MYSTYSVHMPTMDPHPTKADDVSQANDDKNGEDESQSLQDLLKNAMGNASAHGLPNIDRSESIPRKMFWSFLFLAGLALFLWQCSALLMAYYEYPVNTAIELKYSKQLNFPAITICNLNPIKLSNLEHNDLLNELLGSGSATTMKPGVDQETALPSINGDVITKSPVANTPGVDVPDDVGTGTTSGHHTVGSLVSSEVVQDSPSTDSIEAALPPVEGPSNAKSSDAVTPVPTPGVMSTSNVMTTQTTEANDVPLGSGTGPGKGPGSGGRGHESMSKSPDSITSSAATSIQMPTTVNYAGTSSVSTSGEMPTTSKSPLTSSVTTPGGIPTTLYSLVSTSGTTSGGEVPTISQSTNMQTSSATTSGEMPTSSESVTTSGSMPSSDTETAPISTSKTPTSLLDSHSPTGQHTKTNTEMSSNPTTARVSTAQGTAHGTTAVVGGRAPGPGPGGKPPDGAGKRRRRRSGEMSLMTTAAQMKQQTQVS